MKESRQSVQKKPAGIKPPLVFQPMRDQKGIANGRQAPPVYRPANPSSAPVPMMTGMRKPAQQAVQAKQRPVQNHLPPQPYRPATLSIAQQKNGIALGTNNAAQPRREFLEQRQPPPVYRPLNAPAAQPASNVPKAPPVYSPHAAPRLQRKEARPAPAGAAPVRPASFLPRTIQRSAKERLTKFNKERKAIYESMDFDYGTSEMVNDTEQYSGQSSLDDIAASAFSSLGSASTGAVALMKDSRLFFASQTGNAATAMQAASTFGTCVAADGKIPKANMHAEMIIIYYCLTNAIDPKDIQAIGVKDKGCCRLCSAMLTHLGIAFTRTEDSKYEIQWVNPYDCAGKKSPIDISSGVSSLERQLI